MAKVFGLVFGAGNPQVNAGLSPTMIMFRAIGISTYPAGVTDMVGPTITELGVSSGFYTFQYEPGPTMAIFFVADAGSTVLSPDRYTRGVLDPLAAVDEKLGTNQDTIGDTLADPQTVLAFQKRMYAFIEGPQQFNKGTAQWTIFAKGSTFLNIGFSSILIVKQLTNTVSQATRS